MLTDSSTQETIKGEDFRISTVEIRFPDTYKIDSFIQGKIYKRIINKQRVKLKPGEKDTENESDALVDKLQKELKDEDVDKYRERIEALGFGSFIS